MSRAALAVLFIAALVAAKDPDAGKDMVELVQTYGYPIEEHFVTTEDGYILGVFRIPHGRAEAAALNATADSTLTAGSKPVAILQHGLLDSSYTWVNNMPGESLAYLLADAGYDVWMGNSRGNTWSKKHVSLDPDSKEFWEFTWDDMARYDLPALIEYVVASTGVAQVSYVGHSQGTIQAFAAFSQNQTLSAKVNYFGALAPVAYVNNAKGLLLHAMADFDVANVLNFFGEKQFLPSTWLMQKLGLDVCADLSWGCSDVLFWLCGPTNDINTTRTDVYLAQTPAGTSVRNMMHWSQGLKTDKFQKYDYGCGIFSCSNEDHYGQRTPPSYKLADITVPTGLYSGGQDTLADPTDVQRLRTELRSSVLVHDVQIPDYDHMDFVWGISAHSRVYQPLMQHMAEAAQASRTMLRGGEVAATA